MNFGFAIDTRACIGCHACSIACKSENQVPLGVDRTWVKSTETGRYPEVRRDFQVTRCNHCANPPCVRICPVTAMYQRDDGIVEFDPDVCIGCKGCMQACPYDAIHIDPASGCAAKCHFCAHRVERGQEPACVVVCPTHSIIAGDMDDPGSELSRVLARNSVTVRKPEQGTSPKLFYIDGHDVSMHPTAVAREPAGMAFSDVRPRHAGEPPRPVRLDLGPGPALKTADSGTPIRTPQAQGEPAGGPIQVGASSPAGQMSQVAWNAQHLVPWHWPVPAYLVTKAIAAGLFGALSLGAGFGLWPVTTSALVAGGGLAVLMLLATTALLVIDLERPERFLRIVLRPQWRSWIARGAVVLIGLSSVGGLWWALETGTALGWLDGDLVEHLRPPLAWVTLPLSVMAAIYTAFLFAQCEGRDLWQTPLLPVHMLVQSVVAGSAALLVLTPLGWIGPELAEVGRVGLAGGLAASLFVLFAGEFTIPHASELAARAARDIVAGRYRWPFWGGAVALGHVAAGILLLPAMTWAGALAGLCALVGLTLYEHAFVMAPQDQPNS